MAYGVYFAAVTEEQLHALRADARNTVRCLDIAELGHLVTYWPKQEELRNLLYRIVDDGEALADAFWHPLRSPTFHPASAIPELHAALRRAWAAIPPEVQAVHEFEFDIRGILRVLAVAESEHAAILSVLQPPGDPETAARVRCPFASSQPLPFPWDERSSGWSIA